MTVIEIIRVKVALAETRGENKWLAEQLKKDKSTISQWCLGARQSSLENLHKIALAQEIDIRELLNPTKTNND